MVHSFIFITYVTAASTLNIGATYKWRQNATKLHILSIWMCARIGALLVSSYFRKISVTLQCSRIPQRICSVATRRPVCVYSTEFEEVLTLSHRWHLYWCRYTVPTYQSRAVPQRCSVWYVTVLQLIRIIITRSLISNKYEKLLFR